MFFCYQDQLELLLRWDPVEGLEDSWHMLRDVSGSMGQLLAFYFNDAEGISLTEICKISSATQTQSRVK
jgi:hypothetical protein